MELGNIVKTKDQRQGKIVQIQLSLTSRKIYVVEFTQNVSDGFFEEELELVDNTTVWYDVFEAIRELYRDKSKKAVSKKGEIKWIERTLDNISKDKVKDLVYINVNGFEHNILRDIVLESLNFNIWSIVE